VLTVESLPEVVTKAADALKLDVEAIFSSFSGAADELAQNIAAEISVAVSYVIAFATLFFAALIILKLLCYILDKCANLPVLEKLNKFFGVILGAAEALLLGILIAEVSTALCGAYGALNNDPAFVDVTQKTVIAKFLVSIFPW
ncbi:MAG: CvpA family protein, partial [Clostridia bacterium]|nr:CvpA family protein [Clostridia bacterium]